MLTKYDSTKLLDDIKLISKAVKIARDENNQDNRKYACGLIEDLLNRLYNDIVEMTKKINKTSDYDGSTNLKGDNNETNI